MRNFWVRPGFLVDRVFTALGWGDAGHLNPPRQHARKEKESRMHKPIKYVEKAVTVAATGAWAVFSRLNRIRPNNAPVPKGWDKPLLKSWEKAKPPLGWPRASASQC